MRFTSFPSFFSSVTEGVTIGLLQELTALRCACSTIACPSSIVISCGRIPIKAKGSVVSFSRIKPPFLLGSSSVTAKAIPSITSILITPAPTLRAVFP